jgi:hypothetical protein
VAGIVDHHVETPVVGDDFGDAGSGGLVGGDVKLDGPEIDIALFGIAAALATCGALRPMVSRMLA